MKEYYDEEFLNIINSYINDDLFLKTKYIEHHGITRYDHLYRIAYYSYKITKILHLDYKSATIGGLLHDFFITNPNLTKKERAKSFFMHPKLALKTASLRFNLNPIEENIIQSHMFPVNFVVPIYFESWVVSLIDKTLSTIELSFKFKKEISYAYHVLLLFLFNKIK